MKTALKWASFALGSVGCGVGVMLTQAPGKNHSLDLSFLVASIILLGLAGWMLKRGDGASVVRNTALTLAALEALLAAYGVASIITSRG